MTRQVKWRELSPREIHERFESLIRRVEILEEHVGLSPKLEYPPELAAIKENK